MSRQKDRSKNLRRILRSREEMIFWKGQKDWHKRMKKFQLKLQQKRMKFKKHLTTYLTIMKNHSRHKLTSQQKLKNNHKQAY